MRLTVFALARPTFDVALAESHAAQALATLQAAGHEIAGDAGLLMDSDAFETRLAAVRARPTDAVVVLQASFCDAAMVTRLAQAFASPILVWAFPEPRTGGRLRLNSFCGLNLAAHALGRRDRGCAYVYAPPEAAPAVETLLARRAPVDRLRTADDPAPDAARRALDAIAGFFGLVGEHPPGFDTCDFDEDELRRLFGIGVAHISLGTLFQSARGQDAGRIAALAADVGREVVNLEEMDAEAVDKTLRCYAALSDAVDAGRLKGIAIRCWPETFTDYGCAVCGAVARLGADLTPAGCEADMLGTITARLLQELAGEPAMLADVVDMNDATDTTVLWHCGQAPLTMHDPSTPAQATVHSNRRKPLLYQFPLKPGPVTIARISRARNALKLVVGRGRMIRAPLPFSGTAGTLVLDGGTVRCRDILIEEGVEHHLGFVYGDVKPALLSVASQLGLPVLDLDTTP